MDSSQKDTAPGMIVPSLEALGERRKPAVLIVEDDAAVGRLYSRILEAHTALLTIVTDAPAALEKIRHRRYDVLVSDIGLPSMSGMELLREVRARDLDLPVILVTGAPTLQGAADAVELRAFRYLQKPVDLDTLVDAVTRAAKMRDLARTKGGDAAADRRGEIEAAFRSAVMSLRMAFQPIVSSKTHEVVGYEALMRSSEPRLPNPPAVLSAAEKLGTLHLIGRRIRNLIASEIDRAPHGHDVFVNLHPADLGDRELYDARAPLSAVASRVVLEVTERASLESVIDLDVRLRDLRALGYRMAVDDLGAGYAGLSYFAQIRPDIVKVDMSLVRDVDTDPVRQRIVHSLTTLAQGLDMKVVAEGVETKSERDMVVSLGCDYVQGYCLARPGPPFPESSWDE